MDGELDLTLVLVAECLPEKWDVLALVEEDGTGRVFVLDAKMRREIEFDGEADEARWKVAKRTSSIQPGRSSRW